MDKYMYDRIKIEYEKRSKEDLMQEIMSLENIECSDRCFANECEAGTSIYNINEFFDKLDSLLLSNNSEIMNLKNNALSSWKYIRNGLREMNDPCRCVKYLKGLRDNVNKASKETDII